VKEDLSFSLYFDRTLIIQHTTVNNYTFPDMYANFGTADYNTLNDNFVSFGTAAPRADDGGYVYSKKRIYRVDIWNQAINTQANIDNIYYNGYIYPFYNGMKMVVNNKLGLHIQPTDYTVQYINYNKGYVGIGHTEPECMLDVSGNVGLHSLTIDNPNDEGQSKLYYKTDSGLTLEMSGNDYWSRTAIGSSVTVFSTGSSANAYSNRLQTSYDNNMSFANTSYNAPTPTGYATLGPKVKIKDNAIVGKSFVEANSSAPSNTLIIENALELNNSDVKSYFKDAIAAYFFEIDGGVGSIEDVVRGPGHAACDVSHNVYDENKLTNYGFDLSGDNVNSFMSIPDMYLPSNGEFSICFRYFKSSTANGEDIYNAGIQSIYTSSEQIGTLNIRTDSGDHTKLFIQFGGFKNDGYVNFTTSTGVLATNTWHFIVVNIKPHLSPEIYVNGIFKAVTTSLTDNDAIDGVAPDYPGNYGNLMLTPQKAYDNTSNNVSGTIDGVNIGTVRPYSYTFGVGSTSGNDERKYYSTYMVFGRTLNSDDTSFWTTALDGYEYCLGDLIKQHQGDKFNARNRVYIDNSYVLHAEEANFQKNAVTRGDVKANRLVAGNVTLEHGKAIIATPSSSKGLISAYYFQKYGAKGSIEDDVRGNGYEIKNRLNDSYDSKTYLGTYGINHALTATPDSYTGAQVSDASIVNSYCSVPSMQLPDSGVFTLQFRYYVKHDNDANSANNEFWRATITGEGNNSRVTNSGTLSLIRKGGGIGNSNPDYEGWTLYAHDNDGGGKAFQINGNWKGYEVAQWNTLTLVIKPYSTPIIYLNGVFAPFTDATRYNIINSDWSSKDIGPVTGTPTGSYTNPQYITFGGYNGGTVGGDTNFKQSTQQFQGYIGSYQIFNYALSPDDISYWFYALNGQGASKPKTLSVGKKQSNDHEHGINYDAKFDYVTKYNKSLQHISASDSMKMVISNQINMSHGNTLIYKQDQATRFGFKQSSNADIALNPDVTMEVAHTFRTSNDFLFNSGGPNDSIIYNINNDNTTVFDGTTATVWPYGLYNKLQGERYDTNGIINTMVSTPNWIFQSDNTIKTNNNGEAEILYINRSALNSNHFTIECQIKPNDDDFAGIVLGVDPNTYQALVLYIYPQGGIIRIQLFSEGSGVGDNKFALDYSTGASNVLAESTSHNSNTYSFSNGNSVYINDYSNSSPFYNVKAIINNNIINAYIDNTLIFTVTHSYQHILDKRNIGILSSVMGSYGGVTFKDLRVYNYSSMTMHYLNTNSVNNVNNEITLQGIDNTITIASNTISSDGNLHFTGNLHITGNLRLPHSAIENITYKSSTHIKNIIDINKVTENVVIKPTNTTSTSAVEIINTNNNNEFMTLNSGDSSDTTEQVRFNKSGVGIGTTNAENYALNVVGGNANCYGVYPVGSIIMFGGRNGSTNIPSGWLLCDGNNYTNDDYPMLASIIGTIYGGTTDTNFNVPNLSQRSGVGSADVAGINFSNDETVKNTEVKTGGNAALSTNQLASHSHNVDVNYSSSSWNNNIVKGTSGTSHSGGSGTFDKYFPFTYNYNSSNEEGVGRYAFNKSNYDSGGALKTTFTVSDTIKYSTGQKSDTNYKAHYLHGIPLRRMGALINDVNQTKATNTSGIVVGDNIVDTIEKAYNNTDVKYYYDVISTRNQSNINNATIGTTTQPDTDFYPKSTRIRYIIYSGVHNTTTYPWK
jgi:microcystin-dependent protein